MASMSDLSLGGSPRKVTSDMSLTDLSEINRRLDQIEVDQIKHNKIFKENQSWLLPFSLTPLSQSKNRYSALIFYFYFLIE